MGSTLNRAIPYIDPGDSLNAYPAADQASAERVDTLLFDTGWQPITVQPGFAAVAAPDNPVVRRIGSVLYLRGAFATTGITINNSFTVGTLPVGYRPVVGILYRSGCTNSVQAVAAAAIMLQPAGGLLIRTNGTIASNYHIDFACPLD